jgi:2-iminobutanoate/2-iminopropanoate deaminase
MARRYLCSNPDMPFADAVLVDEKTLYLSGRIGLLEGQLAVPEGVEDEAHLLMQDLVRVLGLAGMGTSDIVQLQIFCSDVSLWARFNAVYRLYFTGQLPPRAFELSRWRGGCCSGGGLGGGRD